MTGRDDVFAELHRALPVRLFTVTLNDRAAAVYRRLYSSHPGVYPAPGTKPMTQEDLSDKGPGTVFLANDPVGVTAALPDHETVAAMGCGSILTLPIGDAAGPPLGTVNLLDVAGHFTPVRIAACKAEVAARADRLVRALLA